MAKKSDPPDPLVDYVRELRWKVSARFGHDPVRFGEYLMEFQEQFRDRMPGSRAARAGGGKPSA